MQRRKGVGGLTSDEGLEYEYVIVDEAARVSPRDLMIPMSQGKRIILVGDHRQLPHIIDEEVAKRMEEGEDVTDESEWLKKSMFQYLFSERLKALEDADDITRRVTLDKQFRMHPELGQFRQPQLLRDLRPRPRSSTRACPPVRSLTTSPARTTAGDVARRAWRPRRSEEARDQLDSPARDRRDLPPAQRVDRVRRKAPTSATASSRSTRPKPTESEAN